jgi:hypothetical protein
MDHPDKVMMPITSSEKFLICKIVTAITTMMDNCWPKDVPASALLLTNKLLLVDNLKPLVDEKFIWTSIMILRRSKGPLKFVAKRYGL